ncbi:MAG: tetraacyldisaccharide 4'-kinase [Pseudomonadales bacterium]
MLPRPTVPGLQSADSGESDDWQWLPDESEPLQSAWYSGARWVRLLTPLSFVYSLIVRIRRQYIENDLEGRFKPPVPTVIVGNINVGGTGKSPLVVWLASWLVAKGHRPGIVSRGYGGRSHEYPLDVHEWTDPAMCGDEPVMIARRTGCPVVVDPNRVRAVRELLAEHNCDVVISDDGLQHYHLDRDVEIAVVDGDRGLGNGLCLPAGPLREPVSRLKEVDFVVINGEGEPALPCEAYHMLPVETRFMHVETREPIGLDELPGKRVHAVAGIGNPDRFFQSLRDLGYDVIEHRFEDHHIYRISDLMFGDTLPVIMTEKDAVKCRLLDPGLVHPDFWYLEINVSIPSTFETALLSRLGLNVTPLKVVAGNENL